MGADAAAPREAQTGRWGSPLASQTPGGFLSEGPKSETPAPQDLSVGRNPRPLLPFAEVPSPGRCSAGASSHLGGFAERRAELSTLGLSSPAGAGAPIQYCLVLSTWLVWLSITGLSSCLLLNRY